MGLFSSIGSTIAAANPVAALSTLGGAAPTALSFGGGSGLSSSDFVSVIPGIGAIVTGKQIGRAHV